jgi:hypothetical protein
MSALEKQTAFALALLSWLRGEGADIQPHPATYGVDFFSGAAIALIVQREFDASVIARARAGTRPVLLPAHLPVSHPRWPSLLAAVAA